MEVIQFLNELLGGLDRGSLAEVGHAPMCARRQPALTWAGVAKLASHCRCFRAYGGYDDDMSSTDGTGALEARLNAARQTKLDAERKEASAAAAKSEARRADIAAYAAESAALVREFIERATRQGIKPTHRLHRSVAHFQVSRRETGPWDQKSERVLESARINCWRLTSGSGGSGEYYLSDTGMNVVPQWRESVPTFAWLKAEYRRHRVVTWTYRKPHVFDVVGTVSRYDEGSYKITLADAMVLFFQDHEAKA